MRSYYKDRSKNLYMIHQDRPNMFRFNNIIKFRGLDTESLIEIDFTEYNKRLNSYYANYWQEWCYDGINYIALDNFNEYTKYNIYGLPKHKRNCLDFLAFKVFHNGSIFYATDHTANEDDVWTLHCLKTGKVIKQTNIRNLAPILNLNTKQLL